MDTGAHRQTGCSCDGLDRDRGTNGAPGGVEDREDAVTGRVHEPSAGMIDTYAAVYVVLAQEPAPPFVT
jgi:hypothetical protein